MPNITPPVNYTYGTVVGRFAKMIADTADDTDRYPDLVASTGTVTFTPAVSYFKNTAIPATFVTNPIVCSLDSDGFLRDPLNQLGVVLLSSDNTDVSPRNWTYNVTMTIDGRTLPSFSLTVVGGTVIDLTTVMPAATSAGTVTVVSESSRIAAETAAAQAAASALAAQTASAGLGTGTVQNVHVATNAAIDLSKTADSTTSGGRLAMTSAERTKLSAQPADPTEFLQDTVAAFLSAGTGITLTYNDAGNVLTIASTGGAGGGPGALYVQQYDYTAGAYVPWTRPTGAVGMWFGPVPPPYASGFALEGVDKYVPEDDA